MSEYKSEFLVIEETSNGRFIAALENASGQGFMVVSSNITPSQFVGEIIYYALMSKKSHRSELREIPVLKL